MLYEKEWIETIRERKGLRGLDGGFVANLIKQELKRDREAKEKLEKSKSWKEFKKSKEFERITKEVRALLRVVYGVFWGEGKREKPLAELAKKPTLKGHDKLLELHISTKERLPYYKEVYKKIFAVTKKPGKILDLACGLNPLSYPYLGYKPEYVANELCSADARFIQKYFDEMQIKGGAFAFNLLEFKRTGFVKYLKADVCFLFKTLDSLETMKWGFSAKLLPELPAKWLVASFSTKSLGGKKEIKESKREWFERLIKKNAWEFSTFSIPNETFYVIKKTSFVKKRGKSYSSSSNEQNP